jgi:hypothetical protein
MDIPEVSEVELENPSFSVAPRVRFAMDSTVSVSDWMVPHAGCRWFHITYPAKPVIPTRFGYGGMDSG